jgi:hypothetical protein
VIAVLPAAPLKITTDRYYSAPDLQQQTLVVASPTSGRFQRLPSVFLPVSVRSSRSVCDDAFAHGRIMRRRGDKEIGLMKGQTPPNMEDDADPIDKAADPKQGQR